MLTPVFYTTGLHYIIIWSDMFFDKLIDDLKSHLQEIKDGNYPLIEEASFSIQACNDVLFKMEKIVSEKSFLDIQNEVDFFKTKKSVPLKDLVYYSEIKRFELRYSQLSCECQMKHLKKEINNVNSFFQCHLDFMEYIRQNKKHLDTFYYTRAYNYNVSIINIDCNYRNPEFNTSHDGLHAKILANQMFLNFLKNRLLELENPSKSQLRKIERKSNLKWTASKVAFTELVYGLHHVNAINNGNTDLKEVAEILAAVFNFEVGDFYKIYTEIKNRKLNKTKFLDEMSRKLIDQINKSNE